MAKTPAEKSPWLKKVLIPFWAVQLIFAIVLLGAVCYLVTYGIWATELIIMIICIVCIMLDITEIILFAIHNLMPITYLVFQCVKTAMWFIILMIAIVTTTSQQRIGDERDNIGALVLLNGLVEAVVLSIVHVGTLIYASVIYHRHRHAKAREFRNTLEQHRYDRFHNEPYGEDSVGTADYQTRNSPSNQHTKGSPTECGSETLRSPVESDDAEFEHKRMPSLGWTQELRGEGEVHELATTRSVRSFERSGDFVEASSPSK